MTTGTSRRQFVRGAVGGGLALGVATGTTRVRAQESTPVVWTATVGGTLTEYAIAGDAIYLGTDQNRLRRVDRTSGESTATVDLEAGVYPGGIAVTDTHVVVATQNDQLAVYRIADLGSDGAAPTYRSQITGRPIGMDTNDGVVCVGTRAGIFAFDPAAQEFRWQRFTENLDVELFAPPLVWGDSEIVVTADTSVLFIDPASGEITLEVPFESPNYTNVLSHLPGAITTAGPYVAYTGSDAHGCCPTWATLVIDTNRRDIVYRNFANTTRQQSGAVSESRIVHELGESTVVFRGLESDERFQMDLNPRFDGIASTAGRTFVADKSVEDTPTTLVAIDNDGYGIAWRHAFDEPISGLHAMGEYLYGTNAEAGRFVAMAQSGDGTALRADEPPSQTKTATTDGGTDGGSTDGTTGSVEGSSGDGEPTDASASRRGFLTNGDDQILEGVGLTGLSIVITLGGILVTVYDMIRGSN